MEQEEKRAPLSAAFSFAREVLTSPACLRVIVAVALANLAVLLMNRSFFPLFDDVFTYARDISISCSGVFCIIVGLMSLVCPQRLSGRALTLGTLGALVAGVALSILGIVFNLSFALVAGAALFVVARGWGMLTSNLSAVRLPAAQAVVCITFGIGLGQVAELPLRLLLPQAVCVGIMFVATACTIVLPSKVAGDIVDTIGRSESAADLAVTRPASFVPLNSQFYVFLILSQAVFGFALRFGEVGGMPAFGSMSSFFVLTLALIVIATGGRFFSDVLANIVILVLVAGFLLIIAGGTSNVFLANGVLTVGTSLFNALMYTVLVALAGRNRLASLSIMGWGVGLASLSTTFGALVGTNANAMVAGGGHGQLAMLLSVVVLFVVGYILFGLRHFSFEATIEGVEAMSTAELAAVAQAQAQPGGEELFDARCHELAAKYGLTPREEETFAMLARGRNREYIEEHLGVSRNTVKAHVKHVYAKLDIHSHQELIDLVEG